MQAQVELYGSETGNSLRAAIALSEAQIVFLPKRMDLHAGAHRQPEFLKLNPAGKVPTLVDYNYSPPLVINQSNAIIQYADAKMPGRLSSPSSDTERFKVYDRFFFFITDVIATSHAAFYLRQMGQREASAPLDERALEHLMAAEGFLDQGYIAGNKFSMADIAAFTFAMSVRSQVPWEKLPRMTRWFEVMGDRPGVRKGMRAFQDGHRA
jgi:GST-like protein